MTIRSIIGQTFSTLLLLEGSHKRLARNIKKGSCNDKYGPQGLYNLDSFNSLDLDENWKALLAETANYGLSKGTWSSYKSALKALKACSVETACPMSFPLGQKEVLTFVAWMTKRGLAAKTANVYLAGIRQCHLVKGVELPVLRTPVVNLVLEGKKHKETEIKKTEGDTSRLPMTPTLLKILKEEIRTSTLVTEDKLLLWTVATLAFNGGFRIHELLARKVASYDPLSTLLGKDIKLKNCRVGGKKIRTLQILIKSEKKDRIGVGTIVDVYESEGPLCPIKAFLKWEKVSSWKLSKKPAFVDSTGKALTGRKFNAHLDKFLSSATAGSSRKVTSHSFRSGIATLMGQLGFDDDAIKAIGRWSSRCFEDYLKLPRTKRLQMAPGGEAACVSRDWKA